jgi:hypothetical protein
MRAGLVFVAVALGVAFWMWPEAVEDGVESATGDRSRAKKPYPRARQEREIRKKNPREEFEAARERGLTEKEVRGIVEEFVESMDFEDQPHRPVEVVLHEWRMKRLTIYLDAMADGFSLSKKQKLDVQAKLPALAVKHVARCLLFESDDRGAALAFHGAARVISEPGDLTRAEQIEAIDGHPISFVDEGIRPRELCDLVESQMQVIGYQDDAKEWIWVDRRQMTLDYGTMEHYADWDDPFTDGADVIGAAGEVFPLSMRQVERLGDLEDESVSPHTPKVRSGSNLGKR